MPEPAAVGRDSTFSNAVSAGSTAASAAHRDYVAEVRANFTRENRAYAHTRVALDFVDPGWSLLICALLLFSGLSARMRDLANRAGSSRYTRVLVYFALFIAVGFVASLPLSWFAGYALEHRYGLSTQSLGAWFLDELKVAGFNVLFLGVVPLLALGYRVIERHPRRWWLWLGTGAIPVTLVTVLLSPLVFDPAFNKFTPLHDLELKREILALAARAGIPARQVFEADKSAQTLKYNAYMTGFGASQRIVLWDTTLRGMARDEILFVMGHEMGHYRLGHIWKDMAFACVMGFVGFFLMGGMTRWALGRLGARWGVREPHDPATLPLYAAALTLLLTLALPITSGFSREEEHEADAFGLEVTHLNDAAARAFLKLGTQNRSDPEPSPLIRDLLYDHPPLIERVRFALDYHPWDQGRPNRYFRDEPRH